MIVIRQTLEAARQAAVLLAHNRLFLGLLAAGLVVSLLGLFVPARVVQEQRGDDLFGVPAYLLLFQFALPVMATYFGMSSMHADLADGSAVHAFASPVPRPCLLLGRWLAVSTIAIVASAVVLGAWWAILAWPSRGPGVGWRLGHAPRVEVLARFVSAAVLAIPAYAAVGVFIGVTFKRPLVVVVLFVIGWEVAISNVPPEAGVRGLTVADPVRRQLLTTIAPEESSRLASVLLGSLRGSDASKLPAPVPAVLRLLASVLVAALYVFSRREYRLRSHGDE